MTHVVSQVQTPDYTVKPKPVLSQPATRLRASEETSKNKGFLDNLSSELKKTDRTVSSQHESKQAGAISAENSAENSEEENSQNNFKYNPIATGQAIKTIVSDASSKVLGDAVSGSADVAWGGTVNEDRLIAIGSSSSLDSLRQLNSRNSLNISQEIADSTTEQTVESIASLAQVYFQQQRLLSGDDSSENRTDTVEAFTAGTVSLEGTEGGRGKHIAALFQPVPRQQQDIDEYPPNSLFLQSSSVAVTDQTGVLADLRSVDIKQFIGLNTTTQDVQRAIVSGSLSWEQGGVKNKAFSVPEPPNLVNQDSTFAGSAQQSKNSLLLAIQDTRLTASSVMPVGEKHGQLIGAEYQDRLSLTNLVRQELNVVAASGFTSQLLGESAESRSREIETDAVRNAALTARVPVTATQAVQAMFQIPSQMSTPVWGQDVGQRVYWMITQNVQHVAMQLNPKHLGPMDVKVSVGLDQQVNVSFTTQHSTVKDALDAAIPRLREMLDNQGLNLGSVNVSDTPNRQYQQRSNGDEFEQKEPSLLSEQELSLEMMPATSAGLSGQGFVDLYA
ncbi:MAG: hypothetical protein GXP08_09655 [Gammaproteobacteria bacterium]|nr:hypothetical protein [Gammaproteobacteria bacterium]